MKKMIIPDPLLMLISLLAIIGFQVYWLADNYDREKRSMQIKTNVVFQEIVRQLQTANLKFPGNMTFTPGMEKRKILINEDVHSVFDDNRRHPGREVITMVNALQNKVHDSLKTDTSYSTIVIAMGDTQIIRKDSLPPEFKKLSDGDPHIFNMLYKVDSLQDTIKLQDIRAKYSAALQKENIRVPFSVTRSQGAKPEDEDDMSKVVIGFAHPFTYQLSLLNTTPYLLKKLSMPILFSLLLITLTIVSFVLLYRNLLRQQRLAEIKSDFISNVTHELKTPIATVSVAIEALRNFNAINDAQKTKEYLDISSNELQRL
ncbi:MAG: histidine kinase dimerization/phospho-acceptor domain-containing protein, partial [Ginsengibacter sp.]